MKYLACVIYFGMSTAVSAETVPGKDPVQMPSGDVVTVTLSPPQYVYYCTEEVHLISIILAPTLVQGREMFEFLRIRDVNGIPRCDYLVNPETGDYVLVEELTDLRRMPTRFAGPTAAPLPALGHIYQGRGEYNTFFVFLAFPNIGLEVQSWAYDYMSFAFGPQP